MKTKQLRSLIVLWFILDPKDQHSIHSKKQNQMYNQQDKFMIAGGYSKLHAGFGAGNQKDVDRTIGHLRTVLLNADSKQNTYWNHGGFKIHTLKYESKTIISSDSSKTFETLNSFDEFLKANQLPVVDFN